MVKNNRFIIIGMLLFLILFCSGCHHGHNFYADYCKEMGKPIYMLKYSEVIRYYGEPISTEETNNDCAIFLELKYKDYNLYMENTTSNNQQSDNQQDDFYGIGIEVISDKYEFGPAKIKVGSTRYQVSEAYKNLDKLEDQNLWETYDDDTAAVTFTYDKNDIVTSIDIEPLRLAI